MELLSTNAAFGHVVELKRTDPRHLASSQGAAGALGATGAAGPAGPEDGFGKLLFEALGTVNNLQHTSLQAAEALITDPDSVDVHDVTIAMAEANLALSMTKAVLDRAIRAYREIISIR
jgi:flagellar hook-basal body complex protein FliE